MTPHSRLAAWADSRFVPVVLLVLVAFDAAVGFNWLLSPASSLTSPAYSVAKMLAPMPMYGTAFLIMAVFGATVFWIHGRTWLAGYVAGALPAALWAFWFVLFVLGPLGHPGASYLAAIVAAAAAVLHALAGLAVAHRDGE